MKAISALVASMVVGTLLAPRTAHALDQSVQFAITYDACRERGGPDAFCEQVATATHNVDNEEFFDMAAHGQMRDGQPACEGAHYAAWRVFWLGQRIRPLTQQAAISPTHRSISGLAKWVGRALHTVQDNCAHSGMPNPQHAWFSIQDFCNGTMTSPDAQPEALQCGIEETKAVLDAVFAVLADNGAVKTDLANVRDDSTRCIAASMSKSAHEVPRGGAERPTADRPPHATTTTSEPRIQFRYFAAWAQTQPL